MHNALFVELITPGWPEVASQRCIIIIKAVYRELYSSNEQSLRVTSHISRVLEYL